MDDERYFAGFTEDPPEGFGQALYQQLSQIDQIHPLKGEPLSMNHHAAMPSKDVVLAFPSDRSASSRGILLMLLASVATAILIGMFVINNGTPQGDALLFQPAVDLDALQPITLENVDQLQHLMTLGNGAPYDLALSPDNSTLAVATQFGIDRYNMHDLTAPRQPLPGQLEDVSQVAYQPDGSVLAAGVNNDIWFLDPESGAVLGQIETGFTTRVFDLEYSPDGERILGMGCVDVGCESISVRVWDVDTGELLTDFDYGQGPDPTFSQDLSYIACASSIEDNSYRLSVIHLVDLDDPENQIMLPLDQIRGYERSDNSFIRTFGFSTDNTELFVVVSGEKTSILIWQIDDLFTAEDPTTIEPQVVPTRVNNYPNFFFNPVDGNLIANISRLDGLFDLGVYSLVPGDDPSDGLELSLLTQMEPGHTIISMTFSTDSRWMITQGFNGLIEVFDYADGTSLGLINTYSGQYSYDMGFSANDQFIYTVPQAAGNPRAWDLRNSEPTVLPLSDYLGEDYQSVYSIAINNDGSQVAYALLSGRTSNDLVNDLWVADFPSGTTTSVARNTYMANQSGGKKYGFYDGETLTVVIPWQRILRWHPLMETTETRLQTNIHRDYSNNLAFSADGRLVAVTVSCFTDTAVCPAEPISLWDTETGKQLGYLENVEYGLTIDPIVHFSADGQYVMVTQCIEPSIVNGMFTCPGGNELRVWDISALLPADDATESSAEVSADGEAPEPPTLAPDYVIPLGDTFPHMADGGVNIIPTGDDHVLLMASVRHTVDAESIVLWQIDLEAGTFTPLYTLPSWDYSLATFNHEGTVLALDGYGVVELWGIPD